MATPKSYSKHSAAPTSSEENETTGQSSQTTSAALSGYQNAFERDSNASKLHSSGNYQPGSSPGTVPVMTETLPLTPSNSSSIPTSNANPPSDGNPSSNPPTQPFQNVSPTTQSAPLPTTPPAPQPALQPRRRRMLPARIPSNNPEPPPRTKRIQVTKKQASYTSFSQVIDRVFVATLKNEYKYDPLTEIEEIRLLVINPANKLSDPVYCQLVSAIVGCRILG
jgi:hypothetical protein